MANPLLIQDAHIVSIEFVKGEPMTNSYEEVTDHEKHINKIIIEYFVGAAARTKVILGGTFEEFEEICDCMSSDFTRIVD